MGYYIMLNNNVNAGFLGVMNVYPDDYKPVYMWVHITTYSLMRYKGSINEQTVREQFVSDMCKRIASYKSTGEGLWKMRSMAEFRMYSV